LGVNKTQKTIGLRHLSKYNEVVMKWPYLIVALILVSSPACSDRRELPDDQHLETFIRTMARCAYVERAFSGNPDMLARELGEVDIPAGWPELVDSLLATYGGDPDFWQSVYDEILERSRLTAQQP
jgi:hypothetical protein